MRTLAIWLALRVPAPASWRPWLLGAALGRRPRRVRQSISDDRTPWVAVLALFLALPLAAQTQPDPWHLAAAGGGNNGTVTSVNMTVPSWLDVAGGPITTSGTLAVTTVNQLANLIFAGPATGGAAAPSFRSLVIADLPFTGTPDSTTFARGDGAWATPAGAAGSPYNRVVIVDPAGGGDYTTIEAAVAFVDTQTRSDTARWVIELEPGPNYTLVAPLAVPSYASIVGRIPHSIFPFFGQTRIISPAISSGTFITMNSNSSLANVNVRFSGTLTAPARVIEIAGSSVALVNVTIENSASAATQPLSLVETVTGTTTAFVAYYNYWVSLVSATNMTYYKHQNGGTTYIFDSLARSSTGAAAIVHNTSTGTVSIIRSSLGPFYSTNSDPNTFSLRNDSTGKIEPQDASFWGPTSGTIDDWHQITRVRTFVDTPPATCSPIPSEVTVDVGTVKRLCACSATNTWTCTTPTYGKRLLGTKGADVTSAGDVTLGDGNAFDVTGTTTVNTIAATNWSAGSVVILQCDDSVTFAHNVVGAGLPLLLAGGVDFSCTAGDTLGLMLHESAWREIARTAI